MVRPRFDQDSCVFYPQYWAGIDCSGFVQRVINRADPNIPVQDPNSDVVIEVPNLNDYWEQCVGNTRLRRNRTWVPYYFDNFPDRRVTKFIEENNADSPVWNLLKKGDLIKYDGHVSIMYSDRWGQSDYLGDYDIIHAFGTNYSDTDNLENTQMVFSRKVIVTPNSMATSRGQFPNPIGFGRIKLWE